MMIEINWQEIIGAVVLLIGGLGSATAAGKWFMSARQTAISIALPARMADTGPPDGAVAWAADLVAAMGQAPADSKLAQILAGSNRDQAQAARIAELEAAKCFTHWPILTKNCPAARIAELEAAK